MKRQSSSSRRKQSSIGCMSAIFNLLSQHHIRSKLITSKKATPSAAQSPAKSYDDRTQKAANNRPKRSPALPSDIRRSNSDESTSPRLTVVTRLMGLEDKFPAEADSAEKRRKLLGALEKCDEDLKALQKIIEVVKNNESNNKSLDSVIHDFKRGINGPKLQQQKQQPNKKKKKKPGEEEDMGFIDRLTKEYNSVYDARRSSDYEDHISNDAVSSPLWRISKAMLHSVDEVCKDIAWGERREIGRIGLALQEHICKDLIDEIVREMGCFCCCFSSSPTYSLPFQACKRGLSF